MVKEKIDTIEKLALLVADGFSELREEIDDKFEEVTVAIGHLQDDVRSIKYDLKDMRSQTSEVRLETKAHGKAIDKDAVALINHERRISKLEQASKN